MDVAYTKRDENQDITAFVYLLYQTYCTGSDNSLRFITFRRNLSLSSNLRDMRFTRLSMLLMRSELAGTFALIRQESSSLSITDSREHLTFRTLGIK